MSQVLNVTNYWVGWIWDLLLVADFMPKISNIFMLLLIYWGIVIVNKFEWDLNENKTFSLKRLLLKMSMMTSSNGNIFCVTDPLYGEFTSHWWIPLTKASNAELWSFLWSAPWINGWAHNCEAGDLRSHCPHYDVIVTTVLRTHNPNLA